jgi:hypothetical protein
MIKKSSPNKPIITKINSNSNSSITVEKRKELLNQNKLAHSITSIMSTQSPHSDLKISTEQEQIKSSQFKNLCGMNKPQLTLSCLIFMALEESKDKCLPVREIYNWIEENFPFYKSVSSSGWKSSIRHNLSFSKCFRKMDRNETQLYREKQPFSSLVMNTNELNNGRKRRAPNSTGTCWTVSSECKAYLVQTLKKSSFWFNNSSYYSNLSQFIDEYTAKFESRQKLSANYKKPHQHLRHLSGKQELEANEEQSQFKCSIKKKFKSSLNNLSSSNEEIFENDDEDEIEVDEEETDHNEENDDAQKLLKFVQTQQEAIGSSLDLSLSSSSSSLASAFSMLSASNAAQGLSGHMNSDLEMEVASALVDMKFFAVRHQSTKLSQN